MNKSKEKKLRGRIRNEFIGLICFCILQMVLCTSLDRVGGVFHQVSWKHKEMSA